jgi:hypothetical protein
MTRIGLRRRPLPVLRIVVAHLRIVARSTALVLRIAALRIARRLRRALALRGNAVSARIRLSRMARRRPSTIRCCR